LRVKLSDFEMCQKQECSMYVLAHSGNIWEHNVALVQINEWILHLTAVKLDLNQPFCVIKTRLSWFILQLSDISETEVIPLPRHDTPYWELVDYVPDPNSAMPTTTQVDGKRKFDPRSAKKTLNRSSTDLRRSTVTL